MVVPVANRNYWLERITTTSENQNRDLEGLFFLWKRELRGKMSGHFEDFEIEDCPLGLKKLLRGPKTPRNLEAWSKYLETLRET